MRAALYLRVSTEDQIERYGLAAQRHALQQAVAVRRADCVGEYVDQGISGAVEHRPALDRLVADARARRFDVVLTVDSSRLARDGRLWSNLVHAFGVVGVRVEYLTLPPDETPVGEFTRWMMAGVSQLQRAQIRELTHAGRLAKARSGRFVTGRWPYGYRYAGGQLAPEPGAAAVVADLFAWVADEGMSLRGAVRRLQAQGLASPGGRVWRPTTLHRLLTNPTYQGTAVYNRRRFTPTEGRSPRVTRKPEAEWIMIPVPALVPRELWARAQARLTATRGGRPARRVYLLSGRLRCGVCGRRLHGGPAKSGLYYRCASVDWLAAGTTGRCGLKAQAAAWLDARVWRALLTAFRDPAPLWPHLARRATRRAVADVESQSARVQLAGALARVTRQIDRAVALLLDDTLPQAALQARLATLEGERRGLAARLVRIDAALASQAHAAAQAAPREAGLRAWLAAAPRRMAAFDAAGQAALVRACVDEIVVHPDGALTVTGVLPIGPPAVPSVEPSPGATSRRPTGESPGG